MKKIVLCFVLFLWGGVARADVILGTNSPPHSLLTLPGGNNSGSLLIDAVSNNPPNDIMAAWQFVLVIAPEAGATGNLLFQNSAMPSNYIFDSHNLGIVTSISNNGSQLSANDFDANFGTVVPGTPGANLLQVDVLASANASGHFGIFAVPGLANTVWTDSTFTTQLFSNVPASGPNVLIGDVLVQPSSSAVPEPSSMTLFALGGVLTMGWRWRGKRGKP